MGTQNKTNPDLANTSWTHIFPRLAPGTCFCLRVLIGSLHYWRSLWLVRCAGGTGYDSHDNDKTSLRARNFSAHLAGNAYDWRSSQFSRAFDSWICVLSSASLFIVQNKNVLIVWALLWIVLSYLYHKSSISSSSLSESTSEGLLSLVEALEACL